MVIDNKCKNCGGELLYDATQRNLKCNKCGSIVEIEKQTKKLEKKIFTPNSTIKTSKVDHTQYTCKTCGRKHLSPTDKVLTSCPSCGDCNFEKNMNVQYLPDGIIPFKINKEQAISSFKAWLKKQKLAPRNLVKTSKLEEIIGTYIPVFSYDTSCFTEYSGTGIKYYTDSEGNRREKRTDFHDTRFDNFSDYLESADSSYDSNNLRKLGNYDLKEVCVYRTEYLYGWFANDIDVFLQENCLRMQRDVSSDIMARIRSDLHYDSISNFKCNTNFNEIKYSYLYLPVWTHTYKYKNKKYKCFVNGETGKVSGRAPKSAVKIFFIVLGVIAAMALLSFIVLKLYRTSTYGEDFLSTLTKLLK